MWKSVIVLTCLIGYCASGPLGSKHHVRFKARQNRDATLADAETSSSSSSSSTSTSSSSTRSSSAKLNLPSNATSIRAEIKDGFSCEGRVYGYYADMENDCQIFHVCMPVAYGDGKEHYFRWSFICPEDTIFSQDSFTCMHAQDMQIDCTDSMKYYELNRNFGIMNDENPNTSHRINAEQEVGESEADAETSIAVEETVSVKPVKKTKPFNRKPVRTSSTFTQKPKKPQVTEPTKVEVPVKAKRPAQSLYKRNKPQIVRTTEEPVTEKNVKEIPTTTVIDEQVLLDVTPEPVVDTLESTAASITEETLSISTMASMTEEEENFLKQTAGGFQDVDPTMAAEAEALINDFLQTMMKNENQPVVTNPVEDANPAPAEEVAVVQEVEEFSKTTEAPLRSDMYEIPVAIIHTPLEEIMAQKPQAVEPFRPISIEDVVASVKEHLEKPQETMDSDSTDSLKPNSTVEVENVEKVENEENIIPIYHRLKEEPEPINDLKQTVDKSETESQSTNIPENAN